MVYPSPLRFCRAADRLTDLFTKVASGRVYKLRASDTESAKAWIKAFTDAFERVLLAHK